jgi:uncharacterized protein (DUF2252 family)
MTASTSPTISSPPSRPRGARPAARASAAERAARGKAIRTEVPRSSHGKWAPAAARPDPIGLLEEQSTGRLPELVPIRYGRMSESPFAFLRGAASVMASDFATTPRTGIRVQACGDAHLSNFGMFASPERSLVFDLNDFDETLPGPWEWDVKRLAASIAVAARDLGFVPERRREILAGAAARYREAIRQFAEMDTLDIWYARFDETELSNSMQHLKPRQVKEITKDAAKARAKDSTRAFAKLAHRVNGEARIVADPPLIVPIEDLFPGGEAKRLEERLHALVEEYKASLSGNLRRLIDRFKFADAARKVVGVGSVGTRAWAILLLGRDRDDPLFLQAKEATRSVLEPFVGKSEFRNQGRRVVEGQRLMQATSDILLGWLRTAGVDGRTRDFYVRQLWDWKASVDVMSLRPSDMTTLSRLCGWTLARAHARSGDPIAIAAYLGSSDVFDRAIATFAEDYADQNERDYTALLDAIKSGRLAAETGL